MTEKKIKQEALTSDEGVPWPGGFQALSRAEEGGMERALNAELSTHLGYKKGQEKPAGESNHRNGSSGKTGWASRGGEA